MFSRTTELNNVRDSVGMAITSAHFVCDARGSLISKYLSNSELLFEK